jgi:hypothetical protein
MGSDDRRDGGQQRDLFTARDGHERRRDRGGELRYEGPLIVGDEADAADDEAEDETSGSGKAFFTAAIVGGIVILLVGAALWFRSSTDEMISAEENARLAAATDASDVAAVPAPSEHEYVPPPLPAPVAGSEQPTDYRSMPKAPADRFESAPQRADAAQLTPPEPRQPEPAAPARPAPSEASLRRDTAGGSSVRALVEAGRLDEAAAAGQQALRAAPWSLQVLLACDPANVRRAFQSVPAGPLSLVPAEKDGRACWRLLYGAYPDRDSAVAGIGSVPDYFRQSGKPSPYETR